MSQTFEFYDARAREAATEAKEATLQNVRERNLRAEKSWRGLADQARRVMAERARQKQQREDRCQTGTADLNANERSRDIA